MFKLGLAQLASPGHDTCNEVHYDWLKKSIAALAMQFSPLTRPRLGSPGHQSTPWNWWLPGESAGKDWGGRLLPWAVGTASPFWWSGNLCAEAACVYPTRTFNLHVLPSSMRGYCAPGCNLPSVGLLWLLRPSYSRTRPALLTTSVHLPPKLQTSPMHGLFIGQLKG